LSSSLIKAGYVNAGSGKSNKRVIDSNQAVFDRIQLLNELLERSYEGDEEFADDFSEGLNAAQVGALLSDQDGNFIGQDEYEQDFSSGEFSEGYQESFDTTQLIQQANEEARGIINQANQSAEEIIANARSEAEEIKRRAYEEGMASGEEAGYQEGLNRTKSLEEELQTKIQQNEIDFEEKISQLEPRFVEALTDIYSHVFNVDLSDKTELILYLLKTTIRNIEGGKNFFVHVSKGDYEEVNTNREELSKGLASSCSIEIIEDITLNPGECFIETESGIFDCSLGTELELLKKELRLLSYQG